MYSKKKKFKKSYDDSEQGLELWEEQDQEEQFDDVVKPVYYGK